MLFKAQRTILGEKPQIPTTQPDSFRRVRLEWEDVLGKPSYNSFAIFLVIRAYKIYGKINLC